MEASAAVLRREGREREEQKNKDKKHTFAPFFFLQNKNCRNGKRKAGISRESDGDAE